MPDSHLTSHHGVVVSVRGSVVDARFSDTLPPIHQLLHADAGRIALEVLIQKNAYTVRCIALTPTQGLARGMPVKNTDCATSAVPCILAYVTAEGVETFVAVDQGVLVKHDQQVMVAVRRAFTGNDLTLLQEQINQQFLQQGEAEERQQRLQQRLESGFLKRFADFRHE